MPNFSYMKEHEVDTSRTIVYPLDWLRGNTVEGEGAPRVPKLRLAFAGEKNAGYWNELCRRGTKLKAKDVADGIDFRSRAPAERKIDKDIFPVLVVKELIDVPMDDGTFAESTEENIREFVASMPDHYFEEIRIAAKNPDKFTEYGALANAGDVAGN